MTHPARPGGRCRWTTGPAGEPGFPAPIGGTPKGPATTGGCCHFFGCAPVVCASRRDHLCQFPGVVRPVGTQLRGRCLVVGERRIDKAFRGWVGCLWWGRRVDRVEDDPHLRLLLLAEVQRRLALVGDQGNPSVLQRAGGRPGRWSQGNGRRCCVPLRPTLHGWRRWSQTPSTSTRIWKPSRRSPRPRRCPTRCAGEPRVGRPAVQPTVRRLGVGGRSRVIQCGQSRSCRQARAATRTEGAATMDLVASRGGSCTKPPTDRVG